MKNGLSVLISMYESAISQSNHEGDLIWQKFNGFIVAHSILLAITGQIITSDKLINAHTYLFLISITGLLLGLFWLISTIRGYDALHYWQYSAIEIANKIFKENKQKNYYESGKSYFKDNQPVPFNFDYEDETIYKQKSCFVKCIPIIKQINTEWTAYLSIIIIMILYGIVFFLSINKVELTSKNRIENNIQNYSPKYIHRFRSGV